MAKETTENEHQIELTNVFNNKSNATLVILNQPLPNPNVFQILWTNTVVRIVADGGSNHLHQLNKDLIPDTIIGDLDSIQPSIHEHYHSQGVPILKNQSQDSTDLQKVLKHDLCTDNVFVVGGLGGRFDHTMATFHALLESPKRIIVCNNDSIATILRPGKNVIKVNTSLEGPTCGMIPLFGKTKVKTKGLKWNVDGELEFGKLVSTSNAFGEETNEEVVGDKAHVVTIECDQPLIWTVQVDMH